MTNTSQPAQGGEGDTFLLGFMAGVRFVLRALRSRPVSNLMPTGKNTKPARGWRTVHDGQIAQARAHPSFLLQMGLHAKASPSSSEDAKALPSHDGGE
jgi:hypothetical protein